MSVLSEEAYEALSGIAWSVNGEECDWATLRESLRKVGIDTAMLTTNEWMAKYSRICEDNFFRKANPPRKLPNAATRSPDFDESHTPNILWGKVEDSKANLGDKLNYKQGEGQSTQTASDTTRKKSPGSREGVLKDGGDQSIEKMTNLTRIDTKRIVPAEVVVSQRKDARSFQVVKDDEIPNPVLSQMALEQLLEVDFTDVEDQPTRRKGKIVSLGRFRCEHPSCWDENDKFRFRIFADLARHYKDAHPDLIQNDFFPCDYSNCRRAALEDAFTRKDAYRDHLREYHMEDMAKRHRNPKREQEWLASRIVSSAWWRCVKCLIRIDVASGGWVCPSCKQSCEPERLEWRKTSVWRYNGSAPEIERQKTPTLSQHSIISFDDFRQSRSLSYRTQTSDQDELEQPLSSSQTIRPMVNEQTGRGLSNETENLNTSGPEASSTAVAPKISPGDRETHQHPPIEFTHIEYKSHKIVPFVTIKQLGHGSLGSVDAVRRVGEEEGVILARKVVRIPNMSRKRLLPLIQQEVAVLRDLSHRHIVKVVSTYETTSVPRQFGILISPAGDEDLSHFLERVGENEFPEEDLQRLRKWQYCLASAVAYIHSHNIRHKDIKPSNAICKGDEIYLTDFGSAHQFSSGLTSSTEGYAVGVTKMYSAPEVVHEDRRGRPADIYSLGCVFSEMVTVINKRGIEDFHDFRSEPVPDEPDRMTLCYHATAHKMADWFGTLEDSTVFLLIAQMMAQEQKLRPTADNVLASIAQHAGYLRCNCSPQTTNINGTSIDLSADDQVPQGLIHARSGESSPTAIRRDSHEMPQSAGTTSPDPQNHRSPTLVDSQDNYSFYCIAPRNGYEGNAPIKPLSECDKCSVGYPWESFDGAIYHLRAEHFAADVWEGAMGYLVTRYIRKLERAP